MLLKVHFTQKRIKRIGIMLYSKKIGIYFILENKKGRREGYENLNK